MARKPAHWILRLALGLSLPALASAALSAEQTPTLATAPTLDTEVAHAAAESTPTIGAPTDATPINADATTDAPAEESADAGVEVIRERYPNSAVKVERHVTQDAEGNYYNHGLWTQWDEKGRLVGSGEYRYGKRHGRWLRWYGQSDAPMLQGPLYKDFAPPFVAEATFEDGVLNGTWKVFDSKNRKVSEWEFDHGDRQGKSVWYYPSSQKRREVDYRQGQIDGEVVEWGPDYKISLREKYVDGRRLAPQVDNYAPEQKLRRRLDPVRQRNHQVELRFLERRGYHSSRRNRRRESTSRPVDLVAQKRPEANGRPLRSRPASGQIHLVVSQRPETIAR